MDIIVTTPKKEIGTAALEAEMAKASTNRTRYFRVLKSYPQLLNIGDRIYYVEDGHITGFCVVEEIMRKNHEQCDTTKRIYRGGATVYMRADSWKWIKPIPMQGFRGYRYFDGQDKIEVVGGWLDPRPKI